MVHKKKKVEFYRLQWRPINPATGKGIGDWIEDPSFKLKTPELAWDRFMQTARTSKFVHADVRLVKNGKVVSGKVK